MDKNVKIFVSIIGVVILLVIATALVRSSNNGGPAVPGKYDVLAQCIKDSGATFYGAYWCPHCQGQKKLFGSSAKLLPYVECSLSDGHTQNQTCNNAGITGYPTWKLKDGTILVNDTPLPGSGVKLETLAAKTGCTLPL